MLRYIRILPIPLIYTIFLLYKNYCINRIYLYNDKNVAIKYYKNITIIHLS